MAERRRRRRKKLEESQGREKDPFKRLLSKIRRRGGRRAVAEFLEERARYRDEGLDPEDVPLPDGADTPTSEEFLAHAQGDYNGGLEAGIHRFAELPRFVCEAVEEKCKGLVNKRGGIGHGRPRYHLPILSFIVGLVKERLHLLETDAASRSVEYRHGGEVALDDREVIVSIQAIARAIRERFHFHPTPQGPVDSDFRPLYNTINRHLHELDGLEVDGRTLVKCLGPAMETGTKTSDCYGRRFSIAGSVVEDLLDELDFSTEPPRVLPDDALTRHIASFHPKELTLRALAEVEHDLAPQSDSPPVRGDVHIGDSSPAEEGEAGRVFGRVRVTCDATTFDCESEVLVDPETGESLRVDGAPSPLQQDSDGVSGYSDSSPVTERCSHWDFNEAGDRVNMSLETVDVAALYDRLVPAREDVTEGFTRQATKSADLEKRVDPMTAPEREAKGIEWQQRAARTSKAHEKKVRHVSVGAFRKGQATSRVDRSKCPCTVPFVVFELDTTYEEPRPALCYEAALRIGERLEELGMRPEDILGSYSGNESIHIRVPSGAINADGRPQVFRAPRDAKAAIERFYDLVLEGVRLPRGVKVDRNLANPAATIRAVGSVHEKRYLRAYKRALKLIEQVEDLPVSSRERAIEALPFPEEACEMLLRDFRAEGREVARGRILFPHRAARSAAMHYFCVSFYFDDVPGLETLKAYSTCYQGLTFKRPSSAEYAEGLARLFDEAVQASLEVRQRQRGAQEGDYESRGIVEAILDGVAPGEEFHPGYVGRNYAALILSRYYVTHSYSREEAREAVENWNASLEVPLGEHPEDDRGELDYVFRRATRELVSAAESLP